MAPLKPRLTIIGLHYAPEPSGNAPYTSSLAEGLSNAGYDVLVITGYPHYPEWSLRPGYSGLTMNEVVNGIRVKRLRHPVPQIPNTIRRLQMELVFGLRAFLCNWGSPDLVLVVSPGLFSCLLPILRVLLSFRRPALAIWVQDLYSHGVVETGSGGKVLGYVMKLIESKALKSCDGVVAIHERFKNYIIRDLGVVGENVQVVRNWTHLTGTQMFDEAPFRHELGWSPQDVVVLHAGNMGLKQGLENVINAAILAAERKSNVRFVLMGDGNQRARLEDYAPDFARLDFVDPLPDRDFQRAMAAADFLLVNELPGVTDMAVPSKLTSYFNAGVPVVAATDEGSVTASEIEASGGGIRVDAGSPEQLLTAIEHLAADTVRCRELADSGLRFRRVTLSKESAIAQYDGFLSKLVSLRGS